MARARWSDEAVVSAAAAILGLVIVAIGSLHNLLTLTPVLLLGGAAWVNLISLLSALIQHLAPDWLRARVLAIFILVYQGSFALGSAAWGAVAEARGTTRLAGYFYPRGPNTEVTNAVNPALLGVEYFPWRPSNILRHRLRRLQICRCLPFIGLLDGAFIRPRRLRTGGSIQRMLSREQVLYLRLEAEGVRLLPMAARRAIAKKIESSPGIDAVVLVRGFSPANSGEVGATGTRPGAEET